MVAPNSLQPSDAEKGTDASILESFAPLKRGDKKIDSTQQVWKISLPLLVIGFSYLLSFAALVLSMVFRTRMGDAAGRGFRIPSLFDAARTASGGL